MRRWLTVVVLMLAAGCTATGDISWERGAARSKRVNDNTFLVAAAGTNTTPPDEVEDMALLSAAEATLGNGDTRFRVVDAWRRQREISKADAGERGVSHFVSLKIETAGPGPVADEGAQWQDAQRIADDLRPTLGHKVRRAGA